METIINKKIDQKEPTSLTYESFYGHDSSVIWEFPSEFKKSWFKQFDLRFIIILLLTCIVQISFVLFFMGTVKKFNKDADTKKIQKRYAHLLLKDFNANELSTTEKAKEDIELQGAEEESALITTISENEQIRDLTSDSEKLHTPSELSREERLRRIQNLASRRTSSSGTSGRFTSALSREVSKIGLLQYISEDQENNFNEELSNIFAQGEVSSRYLQNSTANIKLASYQTIESGNYGYGVGSSELLANLKGSKTAASYSDELSSLTPLEKTELRTVVKNLNLDYKTISEIAKKTTIRKKSSRTAEQVTKVMMSHNRAVQDCYKQAIKKDPELKGKVVVRISVNPLGIVEQVQILQSTIQNDRMLRCIVNRIRRWRDFGECDPAMGTVNYRQTYVFGF